MIRIIALVVAAFFACSSVSHAASHAGGKMDDKAMAKDGAKKDGMAKDGMKKEMTMKDCQDHMAMSKKDGMKKDDAMMKKDTMCADMMKKGDSMMKKDDGMMKKDGMPAEPAKK